MRVLPLLPAAPLVLLGVIGVKTSPPVQAAGSDPPAAVETSHLPTHLLADLGRASSASTPLATNSCGPTFRADARVDAEVRKSPRPALSVGLKVDADAIPADVAPRSRLAWSTSTARPPR